MTIRHIQKVAYCLKKDKSIKTKQTQEEITQIFECIFLEIPKYMKFRPIVDGCYCPTSLLS